ALRPGFICRCFLPGRLLRRLLGFGSFLCNLLACDFHSTLHALTSRQALARLSAAGEVACRRPTVSGSGDCRPTAAGCKLAPKPPGRRAGMRWRAIGSWVCGGIVMRIVAIVIAMLAAAAPAHTAEINAFISTAIKAATDELLPPFEGANGH